MGFDAHYRRCILLFFVIFFLMTLLLQIPDTSLFPEETVTPKFYNRTTLRYTAIDKHAFDTYTEQSHSILSESLPSLPYGTQFLLHDACLLKRTKQDQFISRAHLWSPFKVVVDSHHRIRFRNPFSGDDMIFEDPNNPEVNNPLSTAGIIVDALMTTYVTAARVRSNVNSAVLPIEVEFHDLPKPEAIEVSSRGDKIGIPFIPYPVANAGHAMGDDYFPLSALLEMHNCASGSEALDGPISSHADCVLLALSRLFQPIEHYVELLGVPVIPLYESSSETHCFGKIVLGYEGLSYVDKVRNPSLLQFRAKRFSERTQRSLGHRLGRESFSSQSLADMGNGTNQALPRFDFDPDDRVVLFITKSKDTDHPLHYENYEELFAIFHREFEGQPTHQLAGTRAHVARKVPDIRQDDTRQDKFLPGASHLRVLMVDWSKITIRDQIKLVSRAKLFLSPPGGGVLNALWLPKDALLITFCNILNGNLEPSMELTLLDQSNAINSAPPVCIDTKLSSGETLMNISSDKTKLRFEPENMLTWVRDRFR